MDKFFLVLCEAPSRDGSTVWLTLACGHTHYGWKADSPPAEWPKFLRCGPCSRPAPSPDTKEAT